MWKKLDTTKKIPDNLSDNLKNKDDLKWEGNKWDVISKGSAAEES